MIYLVPFEESYAPTICSWIKSEEDLVQFAGPVEFRYPLTEEQLAAYLTNPNRRVYAVLDNYTNAFLGMGEISVSSENTARLCRILIGNDFRGRGLGQSLILALLQQAFSDPHIQRVELNVYDFNKAAIRCYEHCGFQMDDNVSNPLVPWKDWHCLRMFVLRDAEAK